MKKVSLWVLQVLSTMKNREEGQSMVEYGLIIALVAVLVIGGLTALSGKLTLLFNNVVSNL